MKRTICLLMVLTLFFCVFSFSAVQAATVYGDIERFHRLIGLCSNEASFAWHKKYYQYNSRRSGRRYQHYRTFALLKKFLLGQIDKFPVESTAQPKFHCFLLLGQSNMAGYPKTQTADKVEDPRVLVLGYDNNPALGRVTDQWDVACPPLHETYQGAIGPGDWFAKL